MIKMALIDLLEMILIG
ncbi:unnamed protein product, partial [Rotaria magnacalcarata]